MSCESVRAGLIGGESLEPLAEHLAACPACRLLVAAVPPTVEATPPPVDLPRMRRRARSETAAAVGVLLAAAIIVTLLLRPVPPPPLAVVTPTPPPEITDSGDPLDQPEQLARFELGADLYDEPFDDVAPVITFDDPTNLLSTALLGEGNP